MVLLLSGAVLMAPKAVSGQNFDLYYQDREKSAKGSMSKYGQPLSGPVLQK